MAEDLIQAKWADGDIHLEGEYTHGLIVLPTGEPGGYRLAFAADTKQQLAELCATVLGMVLDNGDMLDEVRLALARTEGIWPGGPDENEVAH